MDEKETCCKQEGDREQVEGGGLRCKRIKRKQKGETRNKDEREDKHEERQGRHRRERGQEMERNRIMKNKERWRKSIIGTEMRKYKDEEKNKERRRAGIQLRERTGEHKGEGKEKRRGRTGRKREQG
jgi:hypothetical protein